MTSREDLIQATCACPSAYENGPGTVMEAPAGALIARRSHPMQSEMVLDTDAPGFTRDLGVAENSPARPPYSSPTEGCAAQLHQLERWFGTAVFAEALRSYQDREDYRARERGTDPDRLVRLLKLAQGDAEPAPYMADLIAKANARPVAAPFPGVAVPTQPTAAATAT